MLKRESLKACFARVSSLKRIAELDPTSDLKRQTYLNTLAKAEELQRIDLDKRGRDFEQHGQGTEWYEAIMLRYPITKNDDGKFIVTSEAREWKCEHRMPFGSFHEALGKVSQLISFCDRDRSIGIGDRAHDITHAIDVYHWKPKQ